MRGASCWMRRRVKAAVPAGAAGGVIGRVAVEHVMNHRHERLGWQQLTAKVAQACFVLDQPRVLQGPARLVVAGDQPGTLAIRQGDPLRLAGGHQRGVGGMPGAGNSRGKRVSGV